MLAAFARIYEIIVWKDAIRVYDVPIRDLISKLNLFSSWRRGKKNNQVCLGDGAGESLGEEEGENWRKS